MNPTVVTVTPNPSVDRTLEIDRLARGAVHRAHATRLDAGGKGVNVTRALSANGHATVAVLPLGGPDGRLLAALLDASAVPYQAVAVEAPTRSNITLTEADGSSTKVNAPGWPLPPEALAELVEATIAALGPGGWLVGCGSLPDGVPAGFYATVTARAHAAGARVAIDSSGPALAAALTAGPDVIKPNLAELEELVGQRLHSIDEIVAAAQQVRALGAGAVVVSLGARGAILVDGGAPTLAIPGPVEARSDVGAGDTLLAGFLAAGAAGPEALRTAVAWGAAAVALPGTAVPGPDDINTARVELQPARGAEPLTHSSAA